VRQDSSALNQRGTGARGQLFERTPEDRVRFPITLKAVLFDRDGTLVDDVPYSGDATSVRARAGAIAAVAGIRALGLRTGVVTNQSGVSRGLISLDEVENVNRRIDELFGTFEVWCVCPHGPDDGCPCRKPAPGLVVEAALRLGVPTNEILVVGDRDADIGAAHAAGAVGVLIPSERTEADAVAVADRVIAEMPELVGCVESLRRS